MTTIVGLAAAVQGLAKAGLELVREILRAVKDLKNAPIKTQNLEYQLLFAETVLAEIGKNAPDSDSQLEAALKSFLATLSKVKSKFDEFKRKDDERKEKNFVLEVGKNLVHKGSSKQIKEATKLETEFQDSLISLFRSISLESRARISTIHENQEKTQTSIQVVQSSVDIIQSSIQVVQSSMDKSQSSIDEVKELVKLLQQESQLGFAEQAEDSVNQIAQPENDMVSKLELAVDFDLESNFCDATVEVKDPGPDKKWRVIVPSKRAKVADNARLWRRRTPRLNLWWL